MGLACMLVAALSVVGALGMLATRFVPDVPGSPAWPFVFLAIAFAAGGLTLWRSAYVGAPATDEVFEGERGLLLSLMLVSTLALAGFLMVMVVQPDFWRGLLDGLAD